MKIGIIGSGNIGGNLGKHWAKAVSIEEAFEAKADVYLLATPFKAIDRLSELYAGEYGNMTIIDATNPYPERDGEMAQDVRDSNSNASEYTAMKFNTAKTSKAFNTIKAEHLKDRAWRNTDKLAIPFAAQDEDSKQKTQQLIEDIGFDAVYVGDLTKTNVMDPDQKLYGKSVSRNELEGLLN